MFMNRETAANGQQVTLQDLNLSGLDHAEYVYVVTVDGKAIYATTSGTEAAAYFEDTYNAANSGKAICSCGQFRHADDCAAGKALGAKVRKALHA